MAVSAEPKRINRREFLYYMWGAGAGLLGIGACGAATWFALPKEDLTNLLFPIDIDTIPLPDSEPKGYIDGKFWLANTRQGLLAFSMVCPFRPVLYKWVPTNARFECPACGGKYQLNGTYIEGPASRGLDRYLIRVTTPYASRKTQDGQPLDITDAISITVDVRKKFAGKDRPPIWSR